MDDRQFEKLDLSLTEIKTSINEINITIAIQAEQLAEHMRRSLANEKAIERVAEEVKPIQEHVAIVGFLVKALAWGAGAGSLITLLSRLF